MPDENRAFAEDVVFTLRLDNDEKNVYIGQSSVIGRRKEQQDAIKADNYYAYAESSRAIAVLCDGMGGLTGGANASALCSSIVYAGFHDLKADVAIPEFYKSVIERADIAVKNMKGADGNAIVGAGTTLVSVIIDNGILYWASVGDSRIYIVRGDEIICITKDHNYSMILNERVKNGEITKEEADSNPQKEALVSYIGIGGVRYIDMNVKPVVLADGDKLVLCSDGLYRSLSDSEIKHIIIEYGNDVQAAAQALTEIAIGKNYRNQDNTSVVVVAYQNLR